MERATFSLALAELRRQEREKLEEAFDIEADVKENYEHVSDSANRVTKQIASLAKRERNRGKKHLRKQCKHPTVAIICELNGRRTVRCTVCSTTFRKKPSNSIIASFKG